MIVFWTTDSESISLDYATNMQNIKEYHVFGILFTQLRYTQQGEVSVDFPIPTRD